MVKRLFLLDGMALVYRAHFALINQPMVTSKGVNTSALYLFTNTLLDILHHQEPTHIAVAFDTQAPTRRHREFPDYKAQREAMPEDIGQALPHIRAMVQAFNIPVLLRDGYEADDIIGTLVRQAEPLGFNSFMVTPDKDFGQLVSDKTHIYKPGRTGDDAEILGVPEILKRWDVTRPDQVIDILGLWGDAADNIPGVPGIGEKTAAKLLAQYDTLENLLAHAHELKGRQRERLEQFREQALLSKHLATIDCDVPLDMGPDDLGRRPADDEALRQLLVQFELNSIGRRLFGNDFKAGRGFEPGAPAEKPTAPRSQSAATAPPEEPPAANLVPLQTIDSVAHEYQTADTPAARSELITQLQSQPAFAFAAATDGSDPKTARLLGLAFSMAPCSGVFVPIPAEPAAAAAVLGEFAPVLADQRIGKTGHDLKLLLSVLHWRGTAVRGPLFDVMLAHALLEPELRHSAEFMAESLLGYTPAAPPPAGNEPDQPFLESVDTGRLADLTVEKADLAGQLRGLLEPRFAGKGQERVFRDVESPLIPVLADMECEGVRVDAGALAEFAERLGQEMADHEQAVYRLAGTEFNVNSPKQLGEILFANLKISAAPKKTRTGQYATDEQTLLALAPEHEIVRRLLEYRECAKLKSTYADALPTAISPKTGRVHTTYNQLATVTGRLNSANPNLQNIPVRTGLGREIRKAFVPRDDDHLILSADYSQIELRILAALSREPAMIEAFQSGADIHTATAARVFGVPPGQVTPEMRGQAKMVNFGISYGISAFGLAQRLNIPRARAAEIIENYFARFPAIRSYMTESVESARQHGYAQTVTGRRRQLRDISSSNANVRAAAERNAINMPIQGTAADMIKIAMVNIHRDLAARGLRTRMVLQVHDELVFDLWRPEEQEVAALVKEQMRDAIPLDVPLEVDAGVGRNWLEAH